MSDCSIAYFSMEIALDQQIPTYSGGLGVLAGDTIRSAADLSVPMVAVTLLYRNGYFKQKIDENGWQTEEPVEWRIEDYLEEVPVQVTVELEGRKVEVRAWKYEVKGYDGYTVPVYFLDTDLPENARYDRGLTNNLYGGDNRYRLCQEAVLGIGGIRILQALGCTGVERYHMNEGHASLLTLELLNQAAENNGRLVPVDEDLREVRDQCIFTTHTPVPAGHDQFSIELVHEVLGGEVNVEHLKELFGWDNQLNMTHLALELSQYVNGVAKRHGEVSRMMFAGYPIDSITNGVHADTWTAEPLKELFDQYFPGWRNDKFTLRQAMSISSQEIWQAHTKAKNNLIEHVKDQVGESLDPDVFTIGFARRAATYKRGNLLFHDIERLKRIAAEVGQFQVLYAGKAHPQDEGGKRMIQSIFQAKKAVKDAVKVVYLPDYDLELGLLMTAGVDLWLNTPKPPKEASGTSGMKAALNGVPSLSVLDGWWVEGHIEGITGWSIGKMSTDLNGNHETAADARRLYEKLEGAILPMFYQNRQQYIQIMRQAIALNGSFFHTQRMVQEYVLKAYFLEHSTVGQSYQTI